MKITEIAIKYRPSVAILTLMLTVGGLVSYLTISKEAFPSIEIPTIIITSVYPGASPSDIESLITRIVEEEVQSVSGIKEIRSSSVQGVSTIIVEFNPDVSLDLAYQRVRDKVQLAKPRLPGDIEEPIVSEFDVEDIPIMSINLGGAFTLTELKEVAEDLADEIEKSPDVLEVQIIGALEREVQVNVDIRALQGYGLNFTNLIETINAENSNTPGGTIRVDRQNYILRIDGEFREIEREIKDLVIESPGGFPVYIGDVAEVDFGFKERSTYARLQLMQEERGNRLIRLAESGMYPVISLNVKKRSGANILDTADDIQAVLDEFPLPRGTQILITGDQSEQVGQLVTDLENNIISGLIFVVLVLLFFLGVRTATLVGIAIPLSMFLSFLTLQILGQELNFVILFSLIIALGMLVDNAVVIVENIYRYKELGYSRFEAAKRGTAEVGSAVVASTATTVAVFIPMMFWPGITGEFMGYLPMTLIITLTCSLFVAIIINPVITGYFVRLDTDPKKRFSAVLRIGLFVFFAGIALIIGLTNWQTLVVLSLAIPVLMALHRFCFNPVAKGFVAKGMPKLISWYRKFLDAQLQRDYEVRSPAFARRRFWSGVALTYLAGLITAVVSMLMATSEGPSPLFGAAIFLGLAAVVLSIITVFRTPNPYLRNSFCLACLALGFLLLVLGGLVVSFANAAAGTVLLYPAGLLIVMGLVMVLLHCCEILYLGGIQSVKAGGFFALLSSTILGLMSLIRGAEFQTILILLCLPAIVMIIGALGYFMNGKLLKHRTRILLTDNRTRLLVGVTGGFVAIIGLFAAAPTGIEFFPDTDPTFITVDMKLPLGTHLDETNNVANITQSRVEELLHKYNNDRDNIKNMLMNVGTGSGGDGLTGGGPGSPERALLTLNVVDYGDRPESSRNTLQRLRESLQGIPGVTFEINKDNAGPPVGKPVNIEITGQNFTEITRITEEVTASLRQAAANGTIPDLVDLNNNLNAGRPEVRILIDRERAARLGLDTRKISNVVRSAVQGSEATKYRFGEEEYDVTVRLGEEQRASLEALNQLTILHEGAHIPLSSIADFEAASGYGSITRLDLSRVATITGDVVAGANGAAVLQQVQAHLEDYRNSLPPGYQLTYTGESEDQAEAFGFLQTAMAIGVAAITLILIAQFNSVIVPIIIMLAVALGLIGVLLGLILTRTPFGLMTFIGVISLAGIVVNNNIVLIDYIRQLRDRGLSKAEAIIDGGATRLRPVLLTFLTTVIGLVPLTFGLNIDFVGLFADLAPNIQFGSENTQFWGPMGTAIISGLTFATFLTLVIVPVMYSAFDSLLIHLRASRSAAMSESSESATPS